MLVVSIFIHVGEGSMPLDFGSFDASVRATKKLRRACEDLGLDESQCRRLEGHVSGICGELAGGRRARGKRTRTKWQQCISKERAGKPFDPQAIKKLAEKYRRGECP